MSPDILFPLYLSLKVSTIATLIAIIVAIPTAWIMSKKNSKVMEFLDSIFNLPLVLPPTVLGYYLLVAVGRRSVIGSWLESNFGISLVFTWKAAVLASLIVSIPILLKASRAAFLGVDKNLIYAARTLGRSEHSIFLTITLPLASRGILAGIVLTFARALGDFGTTLMVAGNIPGKTQTMPLAIYDAVQVGDMAQANALVLIITITALLVILLLGRLQGKGGQT